MVYFTNKSTNEINKMKNIVNINSCVFKYKNTNKTIINIKNMHIKKGEHIFIMGKSGSGKSTFLNLLSGVLAPQEGSIEILGTDITKLSTSKKDEFRANNLGIIFQELNLIPYLSIKENISLACQFSKEKANNIKDINKEIDFLLNKLKIPKELKNKKTMNLSVGEKQRVAVARALIGKAKIIIADEPTSALDNDIKKKFIKLLINQANEYNSTLIFVSHDSSLSSYFSKVYNFDDINEI